MGSVGEEGNSREVVKGSRKGAGTGKQDSVLRRDVMEEDVKRRVEVGEGKSF